MSNVDGPLKPEGLYVCEDMCATCVFRPGNRMMLNPGRLRGMIDESIENNACIPCHKTLDGRRAVCRGFWDRYKTATLMCRLGLEFGVIEINPDKEPNGSA